MLIDTHCHLTKDDIDSYIETKDYMGKAGAYGIQGKGDAET